MNRRQFLRDSALASASVALMGQCDSQRMPSQL